MTSCCSFLCCLVLIITVISEASGEITPQDFKYFCDSYNDRGNYTTNDLYSRNLRIVLSLVTVQAANYNNNNNNGFSATSIGQDTNKANAIAQCKGDVTSTECRKCLLETRANLTQLCPNRKEAIGWYEGEKCMLRYSDRSISTHDEYGPGYFMWNLQDAPNAEQFNQVVKNLLDSLRGTAAASVSGRKYAASTATGPDGKLVYGLAQCTPDLSEAQCDNCLVQSIAEIPRYCSNKIGARFIRPSCYLRYETYPFYAPPAPAP